jgi:alcohol dehydrogenase (NADP+)
MHHYADNLACVRSAPLSEVEMAAIADADAHCRLIKGQVFLWEGANGWEDLWDIDGVITR